MSSSLEPKQLVLAKIKGFPDWPAIVVPADQIPAKLKTSKNAKFLDNYLHNDHVCVKFYYDDQYSWTNFASTKPLNDQIIDDYLISVGELNGGDDPASVPSTGKRGGRKKRITEAYLKVKQVPVDEFLEWGSWGKPVVPDLESELEAEEITPEYEAPGESKPVNRKKRAAASAKSEQSKKKQKATKKSTSTTTSKLVQKGGKKGGKSRRGAKDESETPDSVAFDEEEFIINDEAEGDDDYISSLDDSVSVEDDDEDADDADDFADEDENVDDAEDSGELLDDEEAGEVDNAQLEDEEGEEVWGLDTSKAKDLNVKFNEIPPASALAVEVAEMTAWCRELRAELQKLIFPLKKQKQGEKAEKKEEAQNDDMNGEKSTADSATSIPADTTSNQIAAELVKTEEAKEQNGMEEASEKAKEEDQEEDDRVIDYKKINKTIDGLVAPLLAADLSKSILKTTGLMKIINIILKKPELQTPTVRKLNKWWADNFHFKIDVDYRWGDDYTIEMHLQEEEERKEREEERKRRRKEERKSHSLAATPDVEDTSFSVKSEA